MQASAWPQPFAFEFFSAIPRFLSAQAMRQKGKIPTGKGALSYDYAVKEAYAGIL
jgi:hypothetical protein